MAKPELVKVFLHDRGEDVESPWAEDLGPAPDDGAARLVKLVNVPFLHARPTCGDVIEVRRDPALEDEWAWDRGGVPWEQIEERIAESGGRWSMIVDYQCEKVGKFDALAKWIWEQDVVPEGCFGPDGERPGRLYLAVPEEATPAQVMTLLATNKKGFTFTLVHPAPVAAKARTKATKAKATPARAKAAKAKAGTKPRTKAAPAAGKAAAAPKRATAGKARAKAAAAKPAPAAKAKTVSKVKGARKAAASTPAAKGKKAAGKTAKAAAGKKPARGKK